MPNANKGVTSDAQAAQWCGPHPCRADHIHAGLTVVRDSFLEPDGVIINPHDWGELRLLKDQNDNYLGGSPFSNGAAQPASCC